jgi:MtN3 and saliva related transmembrane protein
MVNTEIIGYLAGFLTTIAFLPQVRRTLRTRSAKDISLSMFIVFTCGVILWLIYGIQMDSVPIILANAITLVFAGTILISKLIFERKIIK